MSIIVKLLLLIPLIIAIVACSISLGWNLHKQHIIKQEKCGYITLNGDVSADSRYYYVRVFESDTSVEHLRVPRFNAKHTLDISSHKFPVKITIKDNSL